MTLKELETRRRGEAEGLLRSAQATRRSAYDALAVKGAKNSRERARWHLAAAGLLASSRGLIPRYPRCGRVSFAVVRDAQVSAGRLAI
jgi:hypothetical protein